VTKVEEEMVEEDQQRHGRSDVLHGIQIWMVAEWWMLVLVAWADPLALVVAMNGVLTRPKLR